MVDRVASTSAVQPMHSASSSVTSLAPSFVAADEASIPSLDSFPETGTPIHSKLGGYDWFRSIGSPKRIVAPMVDQSELPWRILSRRHGAEHVYSPMLNANQFGHFRDKAPKYRYKAGEKYRENMFPSQLGEEGAKQLTLERDEPDTDRPLSVQFCANSPDLLLSSALAVQDYCDAVDLNLGCPQGIAKKGHYGAFLQEEWSLIFELINKCHLNLRIPITAKMRVFPSVERTVAYARMLERAGAQLITVHGRTRDMKGQKTGLADWKKIKAVKEAVSVPVVANGNILTPDDVEACLASTGADAVMSAEGNLYNPAIFAPASVRARPSDLYPLAPEVPFPSAIALAHEYLDICANLSAGPSVNASAVRGHLFKILRAALSVHPQLRSAVGKASLLDAEGNHKRPHGDIVKILLQKKESNNGSLPKAGETTIAQLRAVVNELAVLLESDKNDPKYIAMVEKAKAEGSRPHPDWLQRDLIPHWLLQPYFRPLETTADDAGGEAQRLAPAKKRDPNRPVEINDLQSQDEATSKLNESEDGLSGRKRDASGADVEERSAKRDAISEAQEYKTMGNEAFTKGQIDEAMAAYLDGISSLPPRTVLKEDDTASNTDAKDEDAVEDEVEEIIQSVQYTSMYQEEIAQLRANLYANLAACYLKMEDDDKAVDACNQALIDDPAYVKALHRRLTANERKGGWGPLGSALDDCKTLLSMPNTPSSLLPALRSKVAVLTPAVAAAGEKEKDEMLGKLRSVGDSLLGHFGLSTSNFQFTQQEGGGYSMNFVRK